MFRTTFLCIVSLLFFTNPIAFAKQAHDADKINVLIHLTSNNKRSYQATLNYTESLQEKYGNKVNIAIVANGPGIGFVNSNNSYNKEIKMLLDNGVKISACNNTITRIRKVKPLPIINGVTVTPNGIIEVINLQRKGYLYLHP